MATNQSLTTQQMESQIDANNPYFLANPDVAAAYKKRNEWR